jgi:hypothetical protein
LLDKGGVVSVNTAPPSNGFTAVVNWDLMVAVLAEVLFTTA